MRTDYQRAAVTEAGFQAQVIGLAGLCGWQVMHVRRTTRGRLDDRWTTATSIKGWPDLVLWRPGEILFRELKTDKGRATNEQMDVLDSLEAAGCDVGVWRPKDWPAIESALRRPAGDAA